MFPPLKSGRRSIDRIFVLLEIGLLLNRHLFLSQNSQLCQQPLAAFRLKQSAHPHHYPPIMPLPQSSMMPQVPPLAAQAPYLKICTHRGRVVLIVQPQRVRLDTSLECFLPLPCGLFKDAFPFLLLMLIRVVYIESSLQSTFIYIFSSCILSR